VVAAALVVTIPTATAAQEEGPIPEGREWHVVSCDVDGRLRGRPPPGPRPVSLNEGPGPAAASNLRTGIEWVGPAKAPEPGETAIGAVPRCTVLHRDGSVICVGYVIAAGVDLAAQLYEDVPVALARTDRDSIP
jgi:hypothetical protein